MPEFLRPIAHPGQSETLVHFTGRARKDYTPEVYFLTPAGILDLILSEERLAARLPFGSTRRTVCLSESDVSGVESLLSMGQFEGWGIVLRRDRVWQKGGGPIWYSRDDIWQTINARGDQDLLQWMVRTSPQGADWLHEREWRIPSSTDYIDLTVDEVAAILVSDREWEPNRPHTTLPYTDGKYALVDVTNHFASSVPRWLWDGARIEVLSPLQSQENLHGFVEM